MVSVAFVCLYRNILQSRGERIPVIFFKWRTACCVLSQCTEGSLNRPGVTIHPSVPQRRLSLSVPSVQPQGESGGRGPRWSAVTSSAWLFRVPFFNGVVQLKWSGSQRRPLFFIGRAPFVLTRSRKKMFFSAIICCFIVSKWSYSSSTNSSLWHIDLMLDGGHNASSFPWSFSKRCTNVWACSLPPAFCLSANKEAFADGRGRCSATCSWKILPK